MDPGKKGSLHRETHCVGLFHRGCRLGLSGVLAALTIGAAGQPHPSLIVLWTCQRPPAMLPGGSHLRRQQSNLPRIYQPLAFPGIGWPVEWARVKLGGRKGGQDSSVRFNPSGFQSQRDCGAPWETGNS